MLSLWDAIKTRRSIRKFSADNVPDAMVMQLLEAARLAPSGSNLQPWRFIVVRDEKTRKELRHICMEQKFIEEAPVVIVGYADLDRYSKQSRTRRRQEFAESGVLETLSGRFADPKFRASIDAAPPMPREQILISALANTYIAIEHLILMATALGLGTCWVGAYGSTAKLNSLFGLSDNYVAAAIVPVGYPAGDIPPQRPRLELEEILLKPQSRITSDEPEPAGVL